MGERIHDLHHSTFKRTRDSVSPGYEVPLVLRWFDCRLHAWPITSAELVGVSSVDIRNVRSSAIRKDKPARRYELGRLDHDEASIGQEGS